MIPNDLQIYPISAKCSIANSCLWDFKLRNSFCFTGIYYEVRVVSAERIVLFMDTKNRNHFKPRKARNTRKKIFEPRKDTKGHEWTRKKHLNHEKHETHENNKLSWFSPPKWTHGDSVVRARPRAPSTHYLLLSSPSSLLLKPTAKCPRTPLSFLLPLPYFLFQS